MIALAVAIDFSWIRAKGYAIDPGPLEASARLSAICLLSFLALNAFSRIDRYAPIARLFRCRQIALMLAWFAVTAAYTMSFAILSYLSVTLNRPLVDQELVALDRALGFDWLTVYLWVRDHEGLHRLLRFAYDSGLWQIILVMVLLAFIGRHEDLAEFVLLMMLTLVVILIVSSIFPASSTYTYFGVDDPGTASSISDFDKLRRGTLRLMNPMPVQGLVSLPSYHAAMGLLFIWAFRHVRLLFPAAVVLNIALLASTPTHGGHYLVDVIAGLLVCAVMIWLVRRSSGRRQRTPGRTLAAEAGKS
jgi:hypothetical protein